MNAAASVRCFYWSLCLALETPVISPSTEGPRTSRLVQWRNGPDQDRPPFSNVDDRLKEAAAFIAVAEGGRW
jgi:hypothetical protein